MCGIFGWMPRHGKVAASIRETADSLIKSMHHRGPNDAGYVVFDPGGRRYSERDGREPAAVSLLLGHTRLSILDLTPAGHQPMSTEDGRHTLTYNGEIYNYLELRSELEQDGVRFHSHTDTEVLLHWMIRRGIEGLQRLKGMFAFALYDREERTVFCARDFFGIKPFFYAFPSSGFCFASELPALLMLPGVPPRASGEAAYAYLAYGYYDVGGGTFLDGVKQLPSGHCLLIKEALRQVCRRLL